MSTVQYVKTTQYTEARAIKIAFRRCPIMGFRFRDTANPLERFVLRRPMTLSSPYVDSRHWSPDVTRRTQALDSLDPIPQQIGSDIARPSLQSRNPQLGTLFQSVPCVTTCDRKTHRKRFSRTLLTSSLFLQGITVIFFFNFSKKTKPKPNQL